MIGLEIDASDDVTVGDDFTITATVTNKSSSTKYV